MKRLTRYGAALLVALSAAGASAELIIRLNNGLEYRLPIGARDIKGIELSGTGQRYLPESPAPGAATPGAATPGAATPGVAKRYRPSAGDGVIRVGPGRALRLPSQAAEVATDGSVVEIDAGEYRGDVAIWRQHDLTLRGVGDGRAHLRADGRSAGGKAIWVLKGDRAVVENIEFSGARVPDKNGAGIRLEGTGLTVRDSYFHDNEMGILTGVDLYSDVLIENSEFAANRVVDRGDAQPGHNIYIGRVARFVLRNSYFHDASEGHNVKSRALENYILYNRIVDDRFHSSYLVDLSDGGDAYLIGNVLRQGPDADNYTLVSFAAEARQPKEGQRLYLVNNTLINDRRSGVFVTNRSPAPVLLLNNLFVGAGKPLAGAGEADANLATDDPGFVDRAGGDYRLRPGSPALDRAVDAGASRSGFRLAPQAMIGFPGPLRQRTPQGGAADLGAYEGAPALSELAVATLAELPPVAQKTYGPPADHSSTALSLPEAKTGGAHLADLQALGERRWLALGAPRPDPRWGSARGRAWSGKMAYADAFNGAFLYGQGVKGWVHPDTDRYMDDLWFYDAAGHRWVNLYPGTSIGNPPDLVINGDGFVAERGGDPLPVAVQAHGYQMVAWDPKRQQFAAMPNPDTAWPALMPKLNELLQTQAARVNAGYASPWLFDARRGRWQRFATPGPGPQSKYGDALLYIDALDELLFRHRDQIWFYQSDRENWVDARPAGPPPPFGIEAVAAYDPRRNRVYFGGGLYPQAGPGVSSLWVYDVAANAWRDPRPAGDPGGSVYGTGGAMFHYDRVADELLLFRYKRAAGGERGVFAYAPRDNRWRRVGDLPPDWPDDATANASSGFYHAGYNVHLFLLAGDSKDNGRIVAYRHRRG